MEQDQYAAVIAKLPGMEARIVAEMRVRGMMTARELQDVTGQRNGHTDELRRLQRLGLVRMMGRQPPQPGVKGIRPMRYAAVPMEEVEQARDNYKAQRPRKKRPRTPGAQMEEIRSLQWEDGEFEQFYRWRIQMIRYCQLVQQGAEMTFWESVPNDDLAWVVEEIGDVIAASRLMLECAGMRADDLDTLAKIEALENPSGRFEAEYETSRKFAARLRKRMRRRAG